MIHILLPMMVLPIYGSLRSIPNGRHPCQRKAWVRAGLQVVRHIIVPLSLPGVAAGVVLVFVISLGYFITPMLLGGPTHHDDRQLHHRAGHAAARLAVRSGHLAAMLSAGRRWPSSSSSTAFLRLDRVLGNGEWTATRIGPHAGRLVSQAPQAGGRALLLRASPAA